MESLRFNRSLLRLAILALFPLMVACNNDDDENNNPGGNTASEALIFNEGAFGQDNGSLTSYDFAGQAATQALFESANGQKFGGSLNSAYAHDGRIFVTVQTSGGANDKVVVLDATNYTKIAEITNSTEVAIVIPSETIVIGNTLFLSCWGLMTITLIALTLMSLHLTLQTTALSTAWKFLAVQVHFVSTMVSFS